MVLLASTQLDTQGRANARILHYTTIVHALTHSSTCRDHRRSPSGGSFNARKQTYARTLPTKWAASQIYFVFVLWHSHESVCDHLSDEGYVERRAANGGPGGGRGGGGGGGDEDT